MTITIQVPCQSTCTPWADQNDLCSPCDDYGFDSALLNTMLQVASDALFELSGRQYPGVCEDTVRPLLRWTAGDTGRPLRPAWPFSGMYGFWPPAGAPVGGGGYYLGGNYTRDGATVYPEITLGAYPLTSIQQVKIDGVVLPATDPDTGLRNYRVDDYRWLIRMADAQGNNPGWPSQQRMDRDDDQDGTWSVTFTYGTPPPPMGVTACARLACELALLASPETVGGCQLPARVTHLSRQGVDVMVLDPKDLLENDRTGIFEIDLFLQAANPNKLRRRSGVFSPDVPRRTSRLV